MKRYSPRLTGFTLVELLVVITIIGMLMALLLPAVNAAVEAARQITCKNNMRQLGVATVSFESSKQRFPGYKEKIGTSGGPTVNGNQMGFSWLAAILPNLDHHDWYDEFLDPSNTTLEARYSELFICPSDPPISTSAPENSYIINAGCAVADLAHEIPANGIAHDYATNGRATAMEYVSSSDGASYTLLVSESIQAPSGWHIGGKYGATFVWHIGTSNSPGAITGGSGADLRPIGSRGTYNSQLEVPFNENSCRPSSFHSGGVNAVFCDTRTIFLPEDLHPLGSYEPYFIQQQLMTPNGRESHMPKLPDGKNHVLADNEYQ